MLQSTQRREVVPHKEKTAWIRSNVLRLNFYSSNTVSLKRKLKEQRSEVSRNAQKLTLRELCVLTIKNLYNMVKESSLTKQDMASQWISLNRRASF